MTKASFILMVALCLLVFMLAESAFEESCKKCQEHCKSKGGESEATCVANCGRTFCNAEAGDDICNVCKRGCNGIAYEFMCVSSCDHTFCGEKKVGQPADVCSALCTGLDVVILGEKKNCQDDCLKGTLSLSAFDKKLKEASKGAKSEDFWIKRVKKLDSFKEQFAAIFTSEEVMKVIETMKVDSKNEFYKATKIASSALLKVEHSFDGSNLYDSFKSVMYYHNNLVTTSEMRYLIAHRRFAAHQRRFKTSSPIEEVLTAIKAFDDENFDDVLADTRELANDYVDKVYEIIVPVEDIAIAYNVYIHSDSYIHFHGPAKVFASEQLEKYVPTTASLELVDRLIIFESFITSGDSDGDGERDTKECTMCKKGCAKLAKESACESGCDHNFCGKKKVGQSADVCTALCTGLDAVILGKRKNCQADCLKGILSVNDFDKELKKASKGAKSKEFWNKSEKKLDDLKQRYKASNDDEKKALLTTMRTNAKNEWLKAEEHANAALEKVEAYQRAYPSGDPKSAIDRLVSAYDKLISTVRTHISSRRRTIEGITDNTADVITAINDVDKENFDNVLPSDKDIVSDFVDKVYESTVPAQDVSVAYSEQSVFVDSLEYAKYFAIIQAGKYNVSSESLELVDQLVTFEKSITINHSYASTLFVQMNVILATAFVAVAFLIF